MPQAFCDAIRSRFQRQDIQPGTTTAAFFELGKDALKEFHKKLTNHLWMTTILCASTKMSPSLECEVANLLGHGKFKGALKCTLQVLHVRTVHRHASKLTAFPQYCHLCAFFQFLVVVVIGSVFSTKLSRCCGAQFVKDSRQNMRHERQKILFQGSADALTGRHHVFLYWVILGQVRNLCCLYHCLNYDLCISPESLATHSLRYQ